jgi:Fe-S oxidoreductase
MALQDYRNDMMRCSRCSVCKFIPLPSLIKSKRFSYGCPAIARYNFHSYSGGGKLITALSLIDGRVDYSDRLLDVVYKCTLCGSCDLSCKLGTDIEPLEIFHELRAKCIGDGEFLSEHSVLIDVLRKEDNMLQKLKADRGKWAEGLPVKDLTKEKTRVLYHAGCIYSYDPDLQQIAKDTIILLLSAGIDVGIFGADELCCGGRAFEIGYQGEFVKYAESNIEDWNTAGVSKVVTSCSNCYGTLKRLYPRIGKEMKFEILHISEYLNQLIKEDKIKLTKEVAMTVTYHDPCHLGRLSEPYTPSLGKETKHLGTLPVKDVPKVMGFGGVYEPPREVLKSNPGLRLVERERIREYSWCCGAGGGVKEAYPDLALWTARERIEEAKSTGAQAIVTSCPWCKRNFMDAISESGNKMEVYDIIEILLKSI